VVTVVLVTSNSRRVYPFQVLLRASPQGLGRDSKAQAEQVRSIAVKRVGDLIITLDADDIRALDEALRLHLEALAGPTHREHRDRTDWLGALDD
jgi:mRNA interferase MazF